MHFCTVLSLSSKAKVFLWVNSGLVDQYDLILWKKMVGSVNIPYTSLLSLDEMIIISSLSVSQNYRSSFISLFISCYKCQSKTWNPLKIYQMHVYCIIVCSFLCLTLDNLLYIAAPWSVFSLGNIIFAPAYAM